MIRNLRPIWMIFYHIFSYSAIKFNHFLHCFINNYIYFLHFYMLDLYLFHVQFVSMESTDYIFVFNFFIFLHYALVIPYAYVFKESIDCILWLLLALNAILLTSSVNALYLSLLNFCCDFDINLSFFYKFFMIFS